MLQVQSVSSRFLLPCLPSTAMMSPIIDSDAPEPHQLFLLWLVLIRLVHHSHREVINTGKFKRGPVWSGTFLSFPGTVIIFSDKLSERRKGLSRSTVQGHRPSRQQEPEAAARGHPQSGCRGVLVASSLSPFLYPPRSPPRERSLPQGDVSSRFA